MPSRREPDRPNPEAGYMLLAVVVMVALVLIALSVAAPEIAKQLRRDKELESEHRAEQYVRAIRLYQRACKCTSYPASMDALEKNTTVRFLRQKYVDPLTGKSDWRIIHSPQTKIHLPFGQELAGLPAGGLGAAAGMASPGGMGTPIGGTAPSTVSAASPLSAGLTGATIGGSAGSPGSTGSTGSTGDTGMFGDSSSGGPIYGVGTSRSGDSILNPNQQTTYESWEFWYDPRIELFYKSANVMGGGGVSSTSLSGLGGATGSTGSTDPFASSPSGSTGSTGSTGALGAGFGR